jgi:hypothetical protein
MSATVETTMSTKRSIWGRAGTFGVAGALALALTGDGARTATNSGIDPLEILKLQVRPNAIVVLDSSGSMRERPECAGGCSTFASGDIAGDDPTVKLYQAKQVIKNVITNNQTRVSFMFGRYTQTNNYGPQSTPLVYRKVCAASDTTCQNDADAIRVAGGGNSGLSRAAGDVYVAADGTRTYYILSTTNRYYNDGTATVQTNGSTSGGGYTLGTGGDATPTVTVQNIDSSGATINNPVTFTFSGIRWNKGNDDASCGGFEPLVGLAPCDQNLQIGPIQTHLNNELLLDGSGNIQGGAGSPTFGGIRASGYTPIAESLMDIQTEFTNNIFPTPPRPNPRQRTFVIFVTDGDDTCPNESGPASASSNLLISEFRTRGPNGATDEFVEIFNPTANTVNISNWTLRYSFLATTTRTIQSSNAANDYLQTTVNHGFNVGDTVTISGHTGSTPSLNGTFTITSIPRADRFRIGNPAQINITAGGTGGTVVATGPATAQLATVPNNTTLGPGCHYLFTNSTGYSGSTGADRTYTTDVPDNGGLRLTDASGNAIDQVGMSAASPYTDGTPLAPLAGNVNQSYERVSEDDTDDNSVDFALITPSTPLNQASTCFALGGDARALRAAFRAQKLYEADVVGDPTSSVPVFVVAFGSGVSGARTNWIAWGGSGMVRPTTFAGDDERWATAPTPADKAACPTCVDAFTAANQSQLEAAIQAAIDQGASAGHFSDTQSVTDSIFELVNLAGPFDPMDPDTRYDSTLPVLIQATFEMPGFLGHLKAFRNSNDGTNTSVLIWDAADALCWQVTGNRATTLAPPATNSCNGGNTGRATSLQGGLGTGSSTFTFAQMVTNNLIRRRIYTTAKNGVNGDYTVSNLVNVSGNLRDEAGTLPMSPIWPPSALVDPGKQGNKWDQGTLDTALGFMGLTFAQLQTQYGACRVTLDTGGGTLPADCGDTSGGTPSVQLTLARKEARQMILAYTAGAQVMLGTDSLPRRDGSGNILYRARTWILAESTLAAPAVLSPPDFRSASLRHPSEYLSFRDGPRTAQNQAQDGLDAGFGLSQPDLDNDATNAARNSTTIKPLMSVAYYGTNHMLHAFRAGPCPAGVTSCSGEIGGEELWAFVPFDQLAKLRARMFPQAVQGHTYVIATPIRFAYVFVPGSFTKTFSGATVSGDGVWRALLVVGRGAGGKHLTALDVTAPGPFTDSACCSTTSTTVALPPIVVWNRGNPDTDDGLTKTGANNYNNTLADYTAYLGMGETWSVPAVGFVTAAQNTTTRKSQGVEFVAWVGSGFSDVSTEGHTFYALDVLTGDVIARHDVGSGTSAASIPNAIVAAPAAFAGNNPNVTTLTTAVYFADIHSRVFKFLPDSPGTAPALFRDLSGDGDQPIANGLAVFDANSDGSGNKPHILIETGNDSRVGARPSTPRFRLYAFRDNNGTAENVFTPIDLEDGFRGTAAPTATFDDLGGLAFFVATKFNPPGQTCESSFDSLVYALNATTGDAAYDLNASGQDLYATLTNQRVTSTSVAFGQAVLDMGLGVDQPPPPPAPPTQQQQQTGSAAVSVGSPVPGSGGVSWKVGSAVCR